MLQSMGSQRVTQSRLSDYIELKIQRCERGGCVAGGGSTLMGFRV